MYKNNKKDSKPSNLNLKLKNRKPKLDDPKTKDSNKLIYLYYKHRLYKLLKY
jgi:hypothetical protein